MSLNININKMSYNGRSYAECAEAEKRKINRILSVREQSSELAQKLLKKTRSAKEQELKKLQKIKEKELGEWKRKTQCEIQKRIDDCVGNFGDAHIAAVDASCEEDEFLRDKKDEHDLMAAMRGRGAMLQVQRERERELENKLLKKKRQQQKTVGIQADYLTQQRFSENLINNQKNVETDVSEEEETNNVFTVKQNPHKHSEQYNPQNYTTNSVDSSNNCDSESESIAELEEDESAIDNDESELEFNQITNLLRHRLHKNIDNVELNEIIDVGSSDDSESISYNVELPKKVTIKATPTKKKKGILKKSPAKTTNNKKQSSPVKNKKVQSSDNRVRYVDFSNKYETTYVPDKNLIVRSEKSKTNARQNAQIQTDDDAITKKINEDILKKLTDLRSQEALEKEKIRRDYERLRLELDELSKQEREAKSMSNLHKNLSRDQLLRKEEIRQRKMNEAAENAMKKNIITCPPVDRNEKSMRQKLSGINVAAPSMHSREDTEKDKSAAIKLTRSNSEINNLVKVEKLKDLLEKINHQKKLLLNEIEKSDEIPGPDLEKVMDCIKKLEQEKTALNSDNKIDESKLKKIDELNEREKKIQEREKRLENKLRELFKKQQEKDAVKSSSSNSDQTVSDDSSSLSDKNAKKIAQPPVEIIIKVQQPKSPHKKSRKSYRCVDTLCREPGKVYPKTPIKKKKSIDSDIEMVENESQKLPEKEKSQQQTQTSPTVLDAPKPILKNSQLKQISISPKPVSKESTKSSKVSSVPKQKQTADSEDFSVSTVYRELPQQINLTSGKESQRKLNPMLMDYITRVLGMNKNIGSQLNIDVSSVTTPGSSTINTTGNRSSNDEISFDQDRMNRLQKFIDDNHSFISEINESLERVEVQKKQDKDQKKLVEGIWKEILSKKKPRKTSESQSKISSNAQKSKPTAPSNISSKKVSQPPQLPQKEPKKSATESSQKTVKSQAVPTQRPRITQEDMADVTKYLESQMLNNYSEYTANCQRRIAELTHMMEKVRQEKLKLIENSLSSNELNNFTEYKDIVQTTAAKENANGSAETKDSPNRDDPPSEEINNILQFQTRPFGVSKDSGISVSRPVTSSDFRDTPPDRVTSEDNHLFQPILKDIPKLPRMKITTSDGETQTIKDVSVLIKQQQDEKNQKKQRPPLSLKSPQFEKQQHEPHELSTIAEIETPTASKVNIHDEISGVGALHSFPNFEEYAKNNQTNASENRQAEISFPDMNDLMKALPDMNIKTFIEQEGLSLVNFTRDDEKEIPSTDSSLMDIMGELKKRNLAESSFQIYFEDENKDNLLESGYEKDDKTTPTATHQHTEPISPRRRKPAQSRIIMKTPEDTGRSEVIHTPIKEKHHGPHIHEERSLNSNDTLSGIQEIEKDFLTQGMGWAVSTMKKTEASKKQAVSSSSSENQDSIKINFEFDSSSSSSDGKPLNLRDFLRRELLTRSRNDPYLSDDSSLSSKFVKSLLKASHSLSSTSSNDPKSESSQNAKLRTSTPVRMSSENLAKTAASSQIFNGADSVSTLKDSDSSKDKSDKEKSKSL